jgi:WG containing repeat
MKNLFLITCFCTISTFLFGQEKPFKIEQKGANRLEIFNFEDGSNRLKLTISATNDTLFTEQFQRNGSIASREWGRDSMHKFDYRGNLRARCFGIKPNYEFPNSIVHDSAINYHANGQKSVVFDKTKNSTRIKKYAPEGQLINEFFLLNKSFSSYKTESDGQGRQFYAMKRDSFLIGKDTFEISTDTFFHANGKPRIINETSRKGLFNNNKIWIKRNDYFDKNGQLIESIAPRDSFYHTPFKDNITCLYGFKNQYDDVLISPKYEQVVSLNNGFYAIYEGINCQLMRVDGTIIPTPPMTDVGLLEKAVQIESIENEQVTPSDVARMYRQNMHDLSSYFYIKTEGKTGVIDRRGKMVIPPQYLPKSYFSSTREQESFSSSNKMIYVGDADFLQFEESLIDKKKQFWEHKRI